MGLFSPKKIISVASSVYNMAGEEKDRPQYLDSLIVRNVLSGTKDTMATTINIGYTNSPALKFKQFYKWVTKKPERYDKIGIPDSTMTTGDPLNPEYLAPYIPHAPDEEVWVQTALIGSADPTYWAERWIFDNRPNDINTDWVCEYFRATNTITIRFEDTSIVNITASGFNYEADYIYAYYILVKADQTGPVNPGSPVHIGNDPFPDTSTWTLQSSTFTPISATLTVKTYTTTETLKEYSDGRPDEFTSVDGTPSIDTSATSYETGTRIYKKSIYYGGNANLTTENQWMNQWQDASVVMTPTADPEDPVITTEVIDGVTVTTTVTVIHKTETDHVVYDRTYRIDNQIVVNKSYSDMKLMIYQIGSGNPGLDSLVNVVGQFDEFYPFIPMRFRSDWLADTDPAAYEQARKAYKKITGSKIEKLIEDLKDNEDLDDIDNIYAVFGVSLNVAEEACRRYVYRFFENLQQIQIGGPLVYEIWKEKYAQTTAAADLWHEWKKRNNFQHGGHDETTDSDPEPPRFHYPELPKNEIRIHSEGSFDTLYDFRIQWSFISSGSGTGQAKPGAKSNECWIEFLGEDQFSKAIYTNSDEQSDHDYSYEKIRIYWQRSSTTFSWLEIIGAKHRNYVYGGKDVSISAKEALADEDESGFIIPLHYQTYWETSVIDRSQMATASVFIVFNTYDVRKQKWYEMGIFRIIFVIVIAILSVVFTGGAGFGLLGAHMSIGTALGFSGMTAAIVGSIVNAMAALVISTLVEKISTAFGAAGQLIAALFMVFIGNLAAGFQSTGTLAINWSSFLRADNLIKLTDALGKGVGGFMQADLQSTMQESQDLAKKQEDQTQKIQQASLEEFGYNRVQINPAQLTAMLTSSTNILVEGPDTFLTRTTMTGSDIAELSHDMIDNFAEYVNTLPTALV